MNNYSLSTTRIPDCILVDLSAVITKLCFYQGFEHLYYKFPLHDIIGTVLTTQMLRDDGEFIWFEIEKRFEDQLDSMNLDLLQIFIEAVSSEIDEHIRNLLPEHVPQEDYVFHKWIDHTTLMLKRDETSSYHSHLSTPF